MTLPKNRQLTLSDVEADFDKYNFIIVTNSGTIDTSKYQKKNYAGRKEETLAFTTDSSNYDSQLCLIKGITGEYTIPYSLKSFDKLYGSNKRACEHVKGADTIYIYEHAVQTILVKSKRNFLENQRPIK